jgi:hypothetical protein
VAGAEAAGAVEAAGADDAAGADGAGGELAAAVAVEETGARVAERSS